MFATNLITNLLLISINSRWFKNPQKHVRPSIQESARICKKMKITTKCHNLIRFLQQIFYERTINQSGAVGRWWSFCSCRWWCPNCELRPCAENPSSLVFHAAKKRWQVYYLAASRAARIIIIIVVQLGTGKEWGVQSSHPLAKRWLNQHSGRIFTTVVTNYNTMQNTTYWESRTTVI